LGSLLGKAMKEWSFARFMEETLNAIMGIFYFLWSLMAWIVDVIEDVFRKLAGMDPVTMKDPSERLTNPDAADKVINPGDDIVSMVISTPLVQQLFQNLVVVAVALIMFFTILQIIREQFKNKDGGNPYMMVFRMFRGMITMLFITAAVLVGMQVCGIVLRALNSATGGSSASGASASIFRAMSYEANRVRTGKLRINKNGSVINFGLATSDLDNTGTSTNRVLDLSDIPPEDEDEDEEDRPEVPDDTVDSNGEATNFYLTRRRVETFITGWSHIPFMNANGFMELPFELRDISDKKPTVAGSHYNYVLNVAGRRTSNSSGKAKTFTSDFFGGNALGGLDALGIPLPGNLTYNAVNADKYAEWLEGYIKWMMIYQGVVLLEKWISDFFDQAEWFAHKPMPAWMMMLIKMLFEYSGLDDASAAAGNAQAEEKNRVEGGARGVDFPIIKSYTVGKSNLIDEALGKTAIATAKEGALAVIQTGLAEIFAGVIDAINKVTGAIMGPVNSFIIQLPGIDALQQASDEFNKNMADFYIPGISNKKASADQQELDLNDTKVARTTYMASMGISEDEIDGKGMPSRATLTRMGFVERTADNFDFDFGGRKAETVFTFGDTDSGIASMYMDAEEHLKQFGLINIWDEVNKSKGKNGKTANTLRTDDSPLEDAGMIDLSVYRRSAAAADWIDQMIAQKPNSPGVSYMTTPLVGKIAGERQVVVENEMVVYGTVGGNSPATYRNSTMVGKLYEFRKMDYVVGFMGIMIVLGVYLNFAYGLVQRLLEMVVLYIMSPITLAMYPFDNGSAFGSRFVQPFYQKAIAVYAVILSINVFFMLYPVFKSIRFFNDPKTGAAPVLGDADPRNLMMNAFMTICLLGLLPKVRSSIQNILGAESIEEKALGDVYKGMKEQSFKGVKSVAGLAGAIGKDVQDHAKRIQNAKTRVGALADKLGVKDKWEATGIGKAMKEGKEKRERDKQAKWMKKSAGMTDETGKQLSIKERMDLYKQHGGGKGVEKHLKGQKEKHNAMMEYFKGREVDGMVLQDTAGLIRGRDGKVLNHLQETYDKDMAKQAKRSAMSNHYNSTGRSSITDSFATMSDEDYAKQEAAYDKEMAERAKKAAQFKAFGGAVFGTIGAFAGGIAGEIGGHHELFKGHKDTFGRMGQRKRQRELWDQLDQEDAAREAGPYETKNQLQRGREICERLALTAKTAGLGDFKHEDFVKNPQLVKDLEVALRGKLQTTGADVKAAQALVDANPTDAGAQFALADAKKRQNSAVMNYDSLVSESNFLAGTTDYFKSTGQGGKFMQAIADQSMSERDFKHDDIFNYEERKKARERSVVARMTAGGNDIVKDTHGMLSSMDTEATRSIIESPTFAKFFGPNPEERDLAKLSSMLRELSKQGAGAAHSIGFNVDASGNGPDAGMIQQLMKDEIGKKFTLQFGQMMGRYGGGDETSRIMGDMMYVGVKQTMAENVGKTAQMYGQNEQYSMQQCQNTAASSANAVSAIENMTKDLKGLPDSFRTAMENMKTMFSNRDYYNNSGNGDVFKDGLKEMRKSIEMMRGQNPSMAESMERRMMTIEQSQGSFESYHQNGNLERMYKGMQNRITNDVDIAIQRLKQSQGQQPG